MTAGGPKSQAGVHFSAHRRGSAARWDVKVARLAAGQHGLVTLDQLRAVGMDRGTVRNRVELGSLHRVHHGVYAVGHRCMTLHGDWMAAVLACGSGAVLSHRSAAELWGFRKARRARIDVTAPNRRGRTPRGIDSHRDGSLAPGDRSILRAVPCTTPERTLLDIAGVIPAEQLRKAIAEAEVLRLLDHGAVRELIRRSRGRRGVARLRLLLDEVHPANPKTRSELERLFLRVCSRAALPEPEVNVLLDVDGRRFRPDFLWRDARLIIEADSRRFHDTYSAFESDRRREQLLQLAGWRVSRCTWTQVEREPRELAITIRGLLAQVPTRRRAKK